MYVEVGASFQGSATPFILIRGGAQRIQILGAFTYAIYGLMWSDEIWYISTGTKGMFL